MPISQEPEPAVRFAVFEDGGNRSSATVLNDLALPGAVKVQRVAPFSLDTAAFTPQAQTAGTSLTSLGAIQVGDGRITAVDQSRLLAVYEQNVPSTTRPTLRDAGAFGADVLTPSNAVLDSVVNRQQAPSSGPPPVLEDLETQSVRRSAFLGAAATQVAADLRARMSVTGNVTSLDFLAPGLGQSPRRVSYDIQTAGVPKIALIEDWEIHTFVGPYGLGRTLQTFTLLPGEQTTITLQTWRSDESTREDASSIFDSADVSSQNRYSSSLENQSGAAFQDQGGWTMSAGVKSSVSGSIGIASGSLSVDAGFSANHQEARQTFSNSISQTNQDHAAQVNTNRNQSVSQQSTDTTQAGTSTTTVRTISNTNLRRVLNFVFRELNQEYETLTALSNVRVAFYNGHPGSVDIAPISQLREFLARWIIPDRQDAIARSILALVCQCLDSNENPQTMLEVGRRAAGRFNWSDASLAEDGTLDFADDPLGSQYIWRIKPGAIGQDGADHTVAGVVTATDSVVLRTDNVIADALLGQADALDAYAAGLQALDLDARREDIRLKRIDVEKTQTALDLISGVPEDERVASYKTMLVPPPEIEVVPVASVGNGHPGP